MEIVNPLHGFDVAFLQCRRKPTECLYDQCGFRMRAAADVVDAVCEVMKSTLEAGEAVMISGFGKFEVREKTMRRGRNPQTGEKLTLDARRVVTFKPLGVFKGKLNER